MLSKKPWLRIILVVLLIAVIAVVSGAVGYRVGINRLAARADLQMPMRGDFQNGGIFGGRGEFLPRSGLFFFGSRLLTGALPGLLLGIVVLVALAVALDRLLFWPKPAVEMAASKATPQAKKSTPAKSK